MHTCTQTHKKDMAHPPFLPHYQFKDWLQEKFKNNSIIRQLGWLSIFYSIMSKIISSKRSGPYFWCQNLKNDELWWCALCSEMCFCKICTYSNLIFRYVPLSWLQNKHKVTSIRIYWNDQSLSTHFQKCNFWKGKNQKCLENLKNPDLKMTLLKV